MAVVRGRPEPGVEAAESISRPASRVRAADDGLAPRRRHAWQFLLWLALPFVFYVIPELLGFSWSALGENHNVLNPPEGYHARLPDMRITVEAWGASVVSVPLHARLREYLRAGHLPLWNPYQGLGQPFAAEGEGGPYFPPALLWAMVPYAFGNYVTFLMYYLAAVFLYLFLRGMGLSRGAALFGGMAYVLSGALSLHIARPNFADQLSMIPVLFWAVAKAMRERTSAWYAVFAVVAGLHVLAGLLQIAMISALVVSVFCVVYGRLLRPRGQGWLKETLIALGAFLLGNGLGAFCLWPALEAMRVTFNTRSIYTWVGFYPTPQANGIAFFLPLVFGHPFRGNWVPGMWPQVVNWDNLYGFAGTGILLIAVAGIFAGARPRIQRAMFVFFLSSAMFLTLRYLGVSPFVVVNLLPILEPQAPKHSTGLMAFCFVVAAAFALDAVRSWEYRRARWLVLGTCGYLASLILALIGRQGGFDSITDASGAVWFVSVTAFIASIAIVAMWIAVRRASLSSDGAVILLSAVVIGELSVYIPLGNSAPWFLGARVGLFVLIVLSGLALASGRRWAAGGAFVLVLVGYTFLIVRPGVGLPAQFNVDAPPRFMTWLRAAAGQEYRAFGIAPDFSSIAGIQDISTVGPLGTKGFFNLVNAISDQATLHDYLQNTHFMLAGPSKFSLDQYRRVKPIFDWAGVRYMVLDRSIFSPAGRTDYLALFSSGQGLRMAYEDERVMIVESTTAQPKAMFCPAFDVYPHQTAVLERLKNSPGTILGLPMVEAGDAGGVTPGGVHSESGSIPLRLGAYLPNRVRIDFTAPGRGIVVLKDSYFPGWEASLNGMPAKVVRVDAMVRGVMIPGAGRYDLEFVYRPRFFTLGVWLASVIGLFALSTVVYSARSNHPEVPGWAAAAGGVLVAALLMVSVHAYFGLSVTGQFRSLLTPEHRQEAITNPDALRVLYLPQTEGSIGPDARAPSGFGGSSWLTAGDVVLTASGELLRLRGDGRWIRLVGRDGQRIQVVNVGGWEHGRFGGLPAVEQGGRWVIETGSLVAANRNSGLREGTAQEPIPGFWISPGGGGYVVRRMADAGGPFVRVEATRASTYLVLNGQGALRTLDGVPVSIRGQIRAHGSGKATLTLYDVVAADGTAKTYTAQAAGEGWTTLVVRAERVAHPDARDNFSLGLFGVERGDWFDIRELSLFVGTLP